MIDYWLNQDIFSNASDFIVITKVRKVDERDC